MAIQTGHQLHQRFENGGQRLTSRDFLELVEAKGV